LWGSFSEQMTAELHATCYCSGVNIRKRGSYFFQNYTDNRGGSP